MELQIFRNIALFTLFVTFELEVFHPEVFVKYKLGEVPSNTTVVKLNI